MDLFNLKQFRSHIAIVGRFDDDDKRMPSVVETDWSGAVDEFRFGYYRVIEDVMIGDRPTAAVKLLTPAQYELKPQKERKDSDTFVYLSSDSLGRKIETKNGGKGFASPETGGKMFVELLDALDRVMPYRHPGFEDLLRKAFTVFYSAPYRDKRLVTQLTLEGILENPAVSPRFVSALRCADGRESNRRESFREALAGLPHDELSFDPESAVGKAQLEDLVKELGEFRKALLDKEEGKQAAERFNERFGPEYRDIVAGAGLVLREATAENYDNPSAYVRSMFARFRDASEEVETFVENEALLASMAVWFFYKLGVLDAAGNQDKDVLRDVVERNKGGPSEGALSEKQLEDGQTRGEERYDRFVEDWKKSSEDESLNRAVESMAQVGKRIRRGHYLPSRAYRSHEIIQSVVECMRTLLPLSAPGIQKLVNKTRELYDKSSKLFAAYEDIRGEYFDLGKLEELSRRPLAEVKGFKELVAKFSGDVKENSTGLELSEKFDGEFVDFEVDRHTDIIREFAETTSTEVTASVDEAIKILHPALVKLANGEGEPGSLDVEMVVVDREVDTPKEAHTSEQEVSTDEEKRKQSSRGRSAPVEAAREEAVSESTEDESTEDVDNGSRADFAASEDSADRPAVDMREKQGGGGSGEDGDLAGNLSLDQLRPPTKDELKDVESQKDSLKKQMQELYDNPQLKLFDMGEGHNATFRALMRKALLGEYMLAVPRDRSSRDEDDVSLVLGLVLSMVECIGASSKFEGDRRKKLEDVEKERPGERDGSGVWEVPLLGVVRARGGADERMKRLAEFIQVWHNSAKGLSEVAGDGAEMEGVNELLQALADSGRRGRVTIINSTLAEYVEKTQGQDECPLFMSIRKDSGDAAAPPGIVYLTTRAGQPTGDPHLLSGGCLDPVIERLFDKGPLSKGVDGKTEVQAEYDSGESGQSFRWGIPLFIGRNLTVTSDPHRPWRMLPHIGLPVVPVDLWGAVICLTGLQGKHLRQMKHEVGKARSVFVEKLGAVRVGPKTSLWSAWRACLFGNGRHLGPQVASRICTLVLAHRQAIDLRERRKRQVFTAAFRAAREDLRDVYMGPVNTGSELREAIKARAPKDDDSGAGSAALREGEAFDPVDLVVRGELVLLHEIIELM